MIQIKHCWKMSEFSWPSWIDPQSSPITSTLGFIHEKKKKHSPSSWFQLSCVTADRWALQVGELFFFFFPKIILPGVVKRPFLIASLYKLLDSFFLKHFHERKQFLLKHLHLKKKKKRIWHSGRNSLAYESAFIDKLHRRSVQLLPPEYGQFFK